MSSCPYVTTAFLYTGNNSFLNELMMQNFVERSASVTKHTDSSKSIKCQLGDLCKSAVFLGELKTVKRHRKDIIKC